jgi:hypothetical protein
MFNMSFRKFSILSLVLMIASAVTAAIISGSKDKKSVHLAPGSMTDTSSINGSGVVSSITCAPDSNFDISNCACNASTKNGSLTTGGPGGGEITSDNEDEEGPNGPVNTTECE